MLKKFFVFLAILIFINFYQSKASAIINNNDICKVKSDYPICVNYKHINRSTKRIFEIKEASFGNLQRQKKYINRCISSSKLIGRYDNNF